MLYKIRKRFYALQKAFMRMSSRWLSAVLPYQAIKGGRDLLNAEYARGDWDYLRDLTELSRFSVVAGYCQYFQPGGTILEIGCGEGILQERLGSFNYKRFVGVDVSDEAIQRACQKQDEKTLFIREDAATYTPDEQFDIVVFNESLEYFDDPLFIVQRYEQFLAQKGIFILSMFAALDTVRTKRIWKQIETVYIPRAETTVSTQPGYSWVIKVY
jgi:2-polyprenyl-3-methyl-5-hydroxy-6-metoxy-1,4-benzoquinol methylase